MVRNKLMDRLWITLFSLSSVVCELVYTACLMAPLSSGFLLWFINGRWQCIIGQENAAWIYILLETFFFFFWGTWGFTGSTLILIVKISQSCWLFATPWNVVHGILQARILEWVAFPFFRWSSQPMYQTQVSCIADRFFTGLATREAQVALVKNMPANAGDTREAYLIGVQKIP